MSTKRKRAGRPPTPAAERVTVVRLPKGVVAVVDAVIREEAERRGDDVARIAYSRERRMLLGRIIEARANMESLFPMRVHPWVPPGRYSSADLVEIASWDDRQSRSLTATAPACVKEHLRINKRWHRVVVETRDLPAPPRLCW